MKIAMVGKLIDSKLVNALEDGDDLVEDDKVYEFKKKPQTTEKVFEDDELLAIVYRRCNSMD